MLPPDGRYPTVIRGVHESCYRAYRILETVKEMLGRGDSRETILFLIAHYEDQKLESEDEP